MKTFEIKTVQVVTQEQIDDVMCAALEGGISYWCNEVRLGKEPEEKYKWISDVLTLNGTLQLHVDEYDDASKTDEYDDHWCTLTLDKLLKAFSDMQFDFNNYDALDADAAVQRAIFGKIIYG